MKRQLPSQILEQQFFSLAARRAALSESIQLGAQLMLQKAVELEVTEFLGREHYGRSGDEPLRGYRNGYEDKQVQTAEGPLHLKMLAVIDGNSGLRKAIRETFPNAWVQRCQVHRMRNILCKLPEKARPWLKRLLQKAFTAATYKKGFEQAQGIVATYREQFPEAMKCLATDLEEVLTALRFPESHRKRIRTTNLLERLFGEGQRRAKVIPRFMSEKSGLSLMFAVLVDASAAWRGVKVSPTAALELESLRTLTKAPQAARLAA